MTPRGHADRLIPTDKRNKSGTSKLVTWLSESAKRCDRHAQVTPKKSQLPTLSTENLVLFAQRIVDSKDPIIEIAVYILDITKVNRGYYLSSLLCEKLAESCLSQDARYHRKSAGRKVVC
jgi:hypothetical protein